MAEPMTLPRRLAIAAGMLVVLLCGGCFLALGLGGLLLATPPLIAGIVVIGVARLGVSRRTATLLGVGMLALAGAAIAYLAATDDFYAIAFFIIPAAGVGLTGLALVILALFRSW